MFKNRATYLFLISFILILEGCAHQDPGGWVSSGITNSKISNGKLNPSIDLFINNESILNQKEIKCFIPKGKNLTVVLLSEGQKKFQEATRKNVGKKMNIQLCGKDLFSESPTIQQEIKDGFFIVQITKEENKTCLDSLKIPECKK